MPRSSPIRSAWFRRAISSFRGRAWKGCTIPIFTLAALLAVSWSVLEWPDAEAARDPGGEVLRDDAGNVLRVTLGPGDVDCRPFYEADPDDLIVQAVVAVEDGSYWTHCGVRPLSILRAAFQNVFHRRRISGASTISMQAVRLIRPHPKTYWWKFREAVMALKMERAKDKRWILSQYLNRAPFGSNLVGIEAAAQGWFGKGAKDLGLGEAALLAGMVQAPSRFRPDRQLARALGRRDFVLARMEKLGFVTAEQVAAARSVVPVVRRAPRPFLAPHYCDWVLCNSRDCPRRRSPSPVGAFPRNALLPLNADLQARAEAAVDRASSSGGYSSAAVILRVRDGAVRAMAVNGDYFAEPDGQVNTATAPRPAGSTLKPLLAALAMDRALVAPETELLDAPMSFRGYRPANFDGTYRGAVTLRDALVLSLNIPFVKLLDEVGVFDFRAALCELGFAHLGDPDRHGLGLAIGNAEVTLLELASAYATVARGGATAAGDRVLSPEAAYLVSDMLSGDERSSAAYGHVADVALPRFAWKTGTSSAYRDAWTVAWNPEHVVAVWCGHKLGGFGDKTLVGAKASAPIALALARSLYPQNDGPWFAEPAGTAQLKARAAARRTRAVAARPKLAILRPEKDAVFVRVRGQAQQKIVCRVAGNPEGVRLWWFVDGRVAGETIGSEPFALEMAIGSHTVLCSTESGETATTRFTVRDD